jgi:hypothetical protein
VKTVPRGVEIGGGERGDVYKTRAISQGVFDFVVDSIGFAEVKGVERTDGESTFTVVEIFPLTRDTHKVGTGVVCCFSCLNMGIIDREKVEVVVGVVFLSKFGYQDIRGAVVFVGVWKNEGSRCGV